MKASEIDSGTRTEEILIENDKSDPFGDERPRLTLRALHRLRLINDLKKQEAEQHQKFVARMYGSHFEESDEKDKEPDSRTPPKIVKPPKPLKPLKPTSRYLDKHRRS